MKSEILHGVNSMPRITLSDGRIALISTHKSVVPVPSKRKKDCFRRRVSAKILILQPLKEGQEKADIALDISASTTCSENDKFVPRYGRQEAVRRLLRILGNRINKQDREVVIKTLCPELFLTKIDRMKAEYEKLKKLFESNNAEIQKVA